MSSPDPLAKLRRFVPALAILIVLNYTVSVIVLGYNIRLVESSLL